jgi:hypothetical protein
MKARALFLISVSVVSLVRAADLPAGESLIRLCIEREGGQAAVDRTQSAIMTGTVELVGHNISGPLETYQQGEKSYTSIELPGIGKIEEGFDGTVAWEANVLQGPRVKEGDELEAAKRSARISVLGNWTDYYKSAVTKGSADVGGKPAWQVELTPRKGSAEQFFFDQVSGLLVRVSETLSTSLGEIPVVMTIGDYRVVDGIQTPFLMTQSAMSQNMAMHIEKVTCNVQIPASRFDLPPAIKALVAKQKP